LIHFRFGAGLEVLAIAFQDNDAKLSFLASSSIADSTP